MASGTELHIFSGGQTSRSLENFSTVLVTLKSRGHTILNRGKRAQLETLEAFRRGPASQLARRSQLMQRPRMWRPPLPFRLSSLLSVKTAQVSFRAYSYVSSFSTQGQHLRRRHFPFDLLNLKLFVCKHGTSGNGSHKPAPGRKNQQHCNRCWPQSRRECKEAKPHAPP